MTEKLPVLWLVLKDAIVFAAFVALGALMVLTYLRARNREFAEAVFGLGVIGMVALVTEAVSRSPGIAPEWRSWAYLVCEAMVAVGGIRVAVNRLRKRRQPNP